MAMQVDVTLVSDFDQTFARKLSAATDVSYVFTPLRNPPRCAVSAMEIAPANSNATTTNP
jgi:hypothetical protein